ncbi:hypothetical protein [Nostocoides sp. Soil756]|uniref:hypothetical protein n=1 Tax=Nostocoides sp. Soil756 TaxID=1736399 RepID=UPI0006F374D2|nr:hypothetical protein [Tetrasphaera sp. Soil756]KRE62678.1 hypothetical protein ASG78_06675 [Tetrasphaera sp. Soil756]
MSPGPAALRPQRLRVFPDHSADPVWADDGMVDLDRLPVSARLRDALRAWAREWERLLGPAYVVREKDAYAAWLEAGRRHARDLEAELGRGWSVEYTAD